MTQPFGFAVEPPVHDETFPDWKPRWRVWLPHQCASWDIVGGDAEVDTEDRAEAVAELERFITEAQQALAALRAGRAFDAEEQS